MINLKNFFAGILPAILAALIVSPSLANNLIVSNVSLTGQNVASGYTDVRFDISWENSWRTSSAPNNWDAAWIFVKYRVGSGPWNHATLKSTGHTAPAGSTISAPADNTGVFFYRDADGSGTFTKTGVKLCWDYAANGVGANDVVDVKVFALEMVYVPQGAFYVGSPTSETGKFYTYPTTTNPYYITGEDEIAVSEINGSLFYTASQYAGDALGPVPSAFPKGFNAIYVMKYEVSHIAYVEFLNMLPRSQQNLRTAENLAAGISSTTLPFVMVVPDDDSYTGSATPEFRSAISIGLSFDATAPITFFCDLNNNGIPNEIDDGQLISCVFLSWADGMAYLDWTGLRPMSELEFEKSCRGPLAPVSGEQAWGTSAATFSTGLINSGRPDEISLLATQNITCNSGVLGPTRGGMYAKAGTSRTQSGATYYGIMDMSGNLWERPVTLGNPDGRSFTGLHGNGNLDANGNANVSFWPGTSGSGSSFRGGYWASTPFSITHVSNRSDGAHGTDRRRNRFGARGVRTAP